MDFKNANQSDYCILYNLYYVNLYYFEKKIVPAKISGAPLPSATNVTPATSSLNPNKSDILV